jgi:hypothetical protein
VGDGYRAGGRQEIRIGNRQGKAQTDRQTDRLKLVKAKIYSDFCVN